MKELDVIALLGRLKHQSDFVIQDKDYPCSSRLIAWLTEREKSEKWCHIQAEILNGYQAITTNCRT